MNMTKGLGNNRSNTPPLIVSLRRGSSIESIHRVNVVLCDSKGRILMRAGSSDFETFIRSALKPFQALPFISSGTAEKICCGEKGVAIACGSHSGSATHARESFRLLWNSDIDVKMLKCPVPKGGTSPLQHNCSGKHSAFLSTCKKMGWSLDDYLKGDNPIQKEIFRRVAELLGLPKEELVAERDDCGAPTLRLQLSQIALLFAHLGDSNIAELEQISRSIIAHPELIAGPGKFDTELILRAHGQLISKGGAEGIQCISRTAEGMGIAIKVEDGSKRAKHAAALHILEQLEWLTPTALQELQEQILLVSPGVQLGVEGELRFQEQ